MRSASVLIKPASSFIAAFLLIRKAKWNPIGTMALSGAAYTVFHLITGG